MLLSRISEAGWTMKRGTLAEKNDIQATLTGADSIAVYTASSNDNDLPRTIALFEMKQTFEGGNALDNNGVTV